MTAKLLAISLVSLALSGASCSDNVSSRNGQTAVCSGAAVEICRETYPGVFKLDLVDACDTTNGRAPEENEVPMSFCQPCQEKQSATTTEMAELLTQAATCEVDADCAVIYVTPACNFGCGGAFNRGFDADRYNQLATEWNSCTLCIEDRCQQAESLIPPRCEKGRCQLR